MLLEWNKFLYSTSQNKPSCQKIIWFQAIGIHNGITKTNCTRFLRNGGTFFLHELTLIAFFFNKPDIIKGAAV